MSKLKYIIKNNNNNNNNNNNDTNNKGKFTFNKLENKWK